MDKTDQHLFRQINTLCMEGDVLRSALRDLLKACQEADEMGELHETITGDLMHAAQMAIESKTPDGRVVRAPVTQEPVAREFGYVWRKVGDAEWQFAAAGEWPPLSPPAGYEQKLLYDHPAVEQGEGPDDLSDRALTNLSRSLATMITEYVEGGINSNQSWRNGLDHIIARRLLRIWPMRDTVRFEDLPDRDKAIIAQVRADLSARPKSEQGEPAATDQSVTSANQNPTRGQDSCDRIRNALWSCGVLARRKAYRETELAGHIRQIVEQSGMKANILRDSNKEAGQ